MLHLADTPMPCPGPSGMCFLPHNGTPAPVRIRILSFAHGGEQPASVQQPCKSLDGLFGCTAGSVAGGGALDAQCSAAPRTTVIEQSGALSQTPGARPSCVERSRFQPEESACRRGMMEQAGGAQVLQPNPIPYGAGGGRTGTDPPEQAGGALVLQPNPIPCGAGGGRTGTPARERARPGGCAHPVPAPARSRRGVRRWRRAHASADAGAAWPMGCAGARGSSCVRPTSSGSHAVRCALPTKAQLCGDRVTQGRHKPCQGCQLCAVRAAVERGLQLR